MGNTESSPVASPIATTKPEPVLQGGSDPVPPTALEEWFMECFQTNRFQEKKLNSLLLHRAKDITVFFAKETLGEWNIDNTDKGRRNGIEYVYSKVELLLMIRKTLEILQSKLHPDLTNRALVRIAEDMRKLSEVYSEMGKETFETIPESSTKRLVWKEIPTTKAQLEHYQNVYIPIFTLYRTMSG